MKSIALILVSLLSFYTSTAQPKLPEGFTAIKVLDNVNPIAMDFDPSGRLFVTELSGKIWVIDDRMNDKELVGIIPVENIGERGLYGIAFDPDFPFNQYIYVYYSVIGANHNRLSRFKLHDDHLHYEDEEVLLDLGSTTSVIHNGGDIKFGEDGKLYVAVGDGGVPTNAQSQSSLFGKILRINSDGSIPTDNPFYFTNQGVYKSIYAYGLRNPFTFSFGENNKLFANDVGESQYEEINNILPGKNYGWPLISGLIKNTGVSAPADYLDPVYVYDHDTGCAITGSAFYEPEVLLFPMAYYGKYFFGDYCNNTIKVLDPNTFTVTPFMEDNTPPTFIKVSKKGEMYFASFTGSSQGSVWRISYNTEEKPGITLQPESVTASVGDSIILTVAATGLQPLTYQWKKNGVPIADAIETSLKIQNIALSDDGSAFSCEVENSKGRSESETAFLHVTTRKRPIPTIDLSANNTLYSAGDTLVIKGLAYDEIDGPLMKSAFHWTVEFCHDHHTHPILERTGIDSVSFVVPRIGETSPNVWYRIHLEVVNSAGLLQSTFSEIKPSKSIITVKIPNETVTSFPVMFDGAVHVTPFSITSVVGMTRNLSILKEQVIDGTLYLYSGLDSPSITFNTTLKDTTFLLSGRFDSLFLGKGQGLTGKYYNKSKNYGGVPDYIKVDSQLDFNWGYQPPLTDFNSDYFSIDWEGFIHIPKNDIYTFYATSDDGIQLWIDNDILLDAFVDESSEEISNKRSIDKGIHSIKIRYYESTGNAGLKISWSSSLFSKQVIPHDVLYDLKYEPKIDFIQSQDSVAIGSEIFFKAVAKDVSDQEIPYANFLWTLSSIDNNVETVITNIEGTNSFLFLVSDSSRYSRSARLIVAVKVTDQEGFSGSIAKTVFLSGGDPTISMYPNPMNQNLTLELSHDIKTGDEILFFDCLGGLVMKRRLDQTNKRIVTLNVSDLPTGLYIIKVSSGDSMEVRKFFKN